MGAVLKMLDFALQLLDFALIMMDYVLKMMDFAPNKGPPSRTRTATSGHVRCEVWIYKMMDFLFKMINHPLKMMNCVFK